MFSGRLAGRRAAGFEVVLGTYSAPCGGPVSGKGQNRTGDTTIFSGGSPYDAGHERSGVAKMPLQIGTIRI